MFAVIHIGGKQYKVREKDEILVEKVELEDGQHLKIKEVYMISDDEGVNFSLGQPYVQGAHVECALVETSKQDKILVYKMKAKKRYSKTQGHRQTMSLLKVLKISNLTKKVKEVKED